MTEPLFSDLYCDYAMEQTDAPPEFHTYLSYLIVSSVVNKSAYIPFGYKKLYLNLYLLIVAPSSIHRKSWSQGMAMNLIRKIHPDIILHEFSSREAFISELSDQERIPRESGVIRIDELKGFMDRVKNSSHHEGFLQDLSSCYDADLIKRRKGVSKKDQEVFVVEEPFLNITAACSFSWLSQSIEKSDITGGFLARFLWVVVNDKVDDPSPWPKPYDLDKYNKLLDKLTRISTFIGEINYGEEAKVAFGDWYKDFYKKHQGGLWDQNYSRMSTIAVKLAALRCLMRHEAQTDNLASLRGLKMDHKDITHGINLAMNTIDSFKQIQVGENKYDTHLKKLAGFMKQKGNVSRREVLSRFHYLPTKMVDGLIEKLIEIEAIDVSVGPRGGDYYSTNGRIQEILG